MIQEPKISCFNCIHAFLTEDMSVGIPLGLEECKNKEIDNTFFDRFDEEESKRWGYNWEELYACYCGGFEPIIIDTKCPICDVEIKGPVYSWPHWALNPLWYEYVPCCSEQCAIISDTEANARISGY